MEALLGIFNPLNGLAFLASLALLGVYIFYIRFLQQKPYLLFVLFLFTSDILNFFLTELQKIIPLKAATLYALIFYVPFIFLIKKSFWSYLKSSPVALGFALFFLLNSIYYFLNINHLVLMEPVPAQEQAWVRLLVSFKWLYVYLLFYTVWQPLQEGILKLTYLNKLYEKLFYYFAAFCILGILAYALSIGVYFIGVKRLSFIFFHPGGLAFYISGFILYLLAYWLSQKNSLSNNKSNFFLAVILLGSFTLLLSFTKSFIAYHIIASALIIFYAHRLKLINFNWIYVVASAILAGLPLILFPSLLESLSLRLSSNTSLFWRLLQWERILGTLSFPNSILMGNGLASCIQLTQSYTYNAWNIQANTVESYWVHNIYIEHLYDFGLPGFVWLIGFLTYIYTGWRLLNKLLPENKILLFANIVILAYLIINCINNEGFYPMTFAILLGLNHYLATKRTINEVGQ